MKKNLVAVLFILFPFLGFAEGLAENFVEAFEEIAIGEALLNTALEYHTEFDLVLTGLEKNSPSLYKSKVDREIYITILFLYTMKNLCTDGIVGEPFKSKYGSFIDFMDRPDMGEELMCELLLYIYDQKKFDISGYL
jgi:hypothetical protein